MIALKFISKMFASELNSGIFDSFIYLPPNFSHKRIQHSSPHNFYAFSFVMKYETLCLEDESREVF